MVVVLKTPLELAFRNLLKAVVFVQSVLTIRFKRLLKRLENTLNGIKPILNDSILLGQVLDHWEDETTNFIEYMQEGKEVVLKCSRIGFWNVYQNSVCSNKLIHLDKELLRFFHRELGNNTLGISNLDQQLSVVSSTYAPSNSGSCSVPRLPNNIVGFDRHLEELKSMLLAYRRSQVLVVSAPLGFGKTTLVNMLCYDKSIKDIFGKNILYVTDSRVSTLETVAQKLFEHYGENNLEFQTDEEVMNQFKGLIRRHMGSDKMLLVLDNVGFRSVRNFFNLSLPTSGLKILVTSRDATYSDYELDLLNEEYARTLFCNSAFPKDGIHINVPDDLVNKIVKLFRGHPLALTIAGASLCGQPLHRWEITFRKWSTDIFGTYSKLLHSLKPRIDALDEFPIIKECFLDISSFPGDIRIAVGALMDMWVEQYNIDNDYMFAIDSLLKLSSRNLISLPPIRAGYLELEGSFHELYDTQIDYAYRMTIDSLRELSSGISLPPKREEAGELEGCLNELYVTQHEMARQLAINLSIQEPFEERKRLFIEIYENQFPTWWTEQTVQPLNTQILSISTDETFDSTWYDLTAPKVEVLTVNTRSQKYALPQFIEKMDQLKVLSIMSHGHDRSQLHNLAVIGCLSNLKRIRFEHISVSSSIQPIFALQNLKKLSFVMCEIGDALMSCTTESPYMLPNLTYLEIDSCYDLKELPSELCNLIQLKKLSITNCHKLNVLPKGLGSLSNLENLRLRCCIKLQELPKSIGSMNKLGYIDTSDCLNIRVLPEEIGEICGLRVLRMSGCRGLQKLPTSMSKLRQLKVVICDKQTLHLWKDFQSDLYRLKIHIVGNSFESRMKNTHKEAPSIGDMVHDKENSQTASTNFSHSPPSYSVVAPRKGSIASESSDGQNVSEVAPSIGDMVHDKENSQTASNMVRHHHTVM